jgi:hypothetical protein
MPRVQEVVIPYLRENLPGVTVGSWVPDVDYREYPYVNVRRLGGTAFKPEVLDKPVIELTAYTRTGLEETEDLYLDARALIFRMVDRQIVTEAGYLHSFFETFGPYQFDSPFDDTWRIQGLIQLGLRPPRSV